MITFLGEPVFKSWISPAGSLMQVFGGIPDCPEKLARFTGFTNVEVHSPTRSTSQPPGTFAASPRKCAYAHAFTNRTGRDRCGNEILVS